MTTVADDLDSPKRILPTANISRAARARGRLTTRVLTRARAFYELRREWDDLLDSNDQYTFFLRPQWNARWWRHYAPRGAQLHLITCRDERGALVGLAPLYSRPLSAFGIRCGRELLFLGMGIDLKTSEHLDIIAKKGSENRVARAIAQCLSESGMWNRVLLRQVPMDSPVLPHLVTALRGDWSVVPCDRAPYIDTSTDWATFKAGFGRSMRRNVEYYARRLFRTYPTCEFARVQSEDAIKPALDALVELHRTLWRSRGKPGTFRGNVETFVREAASDALASGRLALWTLTIAGKIEAVLLAFVDNGVCHYFQKGFNPAFAKDGMGNALVSLCIRECFNDSSIRAFDFMGGGAPYKDLWARTSRWNVAYEVQRPTFGTAFFGAAHRVQNMAVSTYRQVVPIWFRALRRDRLQRQLLKTSLAYLCSCALDVDGALFDLLDAMDISF